MSDTNRRISGGASMTIDSLGMGVVGNYGYRLSTVDRQTELGADGVHGYSEKPGAPYIKAQLRDLYGIGIAGFEDMTNVTVELILNNGKTITGQGMWLTKCVEVNSTDATFDVQFEGDNVVST